MIESKDVSIVVQGPINIKGDYTTVKVLKSIRTHFPDAEIILSTWDGEDVTGLEYDKLVQSELPPMLYIDDKGTPSNVNRQIASTINGLKQATRKYAIKTRTNTLMDSDAILKIFKPEETGAILKNYVYVIDYFTRDVYKCSRISFYDTYQHHPSDIFLFGLTEDVAEIFSAPPATQELLQNKVKKGVPVMSEQYIWMNLLIRHGYLKDYVTSLARPQVMNLYHAEKWLFDNFKVVNHDTAGVNLEPRLRQGWMYTCIIKEDFQKRLDSMPKPLRHAYLFLRAVRYAVMNNRHNRKYLQ